MTNTINTNNMKNLRYFLLFIVILSNVHGIKGQTTKQVEGSENSLFGTFINMFSTIDDDTVLRIQEIEMNNYPNYKKIDSVYYSLIDRVPFFDYYATFKIEKPEGVLVCIYCRYTSYYVTLSYIDLVTYSLNGTVINSVRLPFLDNAMYFDNSLGFELCDLYVSVERIVYKYNQYRTEKGEIIQNLEFNIDKDGRLRDTKKVLR